MTALPETMPSVAPTPLEVPPDGTDGEGDEVAPPVSGLPEGTPVPVSSEGPTVGADSEGLGAGAVASAPIGTASAARHVAANAAPHTSTLRTPGPFSMDP